MTIYAGETVEISVTAKEFRAVRALNEDDLTAVWVTVYDVEGDTVVPRSSMSWDEDLVDENGTVTGGWAYHWLTTGVDPGTYRAKIEAYGVQATPQHYSLEFKRIRLNRRPVGG